MSLYRTLDSSGRECWGVDWRDEFGHRRRKTIGTLEAAKLIEAQITRTVREAKAGTREAQARASLSLSAARDVWTAHAAGAPKTQESRRNTVDALIRSAGDLNIALVTPDLLARHVAHYATLVAPSTLAKRNEITRSFFGWLKNSGYLAVSPAEQLHCSRPPTSSGQVISYADEARALAAVTPKCRLKILLALDAGLRQGEIHALHRNSIDLDHGTLSLFSNKPPNVAKTIPLTARLSAALRAHAARLAPDSLLYSTRGQAMDNGNDFWQDLQERIGLSARFHDLRHTFGTRLMEATNNPFLVAKLLGHSLASQMHYARGIGLPSHTPRYLHPSPQQLRAAIDRMEAANPNISAGSSTDPANAAERTTQNRTSAPLPAPETTGPDSAAETTAARGEANVKIRTARLRGSKQLGKPPGIPSHDRKNQAPQLVGERQTETHQPKRTQPQAPAGNEALHHQQRPAPRLQRALPPRHQRTPLEGGGQNQVPRHRQDSRRTPPDQGKTQKSKPQQKRR